MGEGGRLSCGCCGGGDGGLVVEMKERKLDKVDESETAMDWVV